MLTATVFSHPSLLLPSSIIRTNADGTRAVICREDLIQLVDVRRNVLAAARLSSAVSDAIWASPVSVLLGCLDGSITIINSLDRSSQSMQPVPDKKVTQIRILGNHVFIMYDGLSVVQLSLSAFEDPACMQCFRLVGLLGDPVAFCVSQRQSSLILATFGAEADYFVQFTLPCLPVIHENKSLVSRIFKPEVRSSAVDLVTFSRLSDIGRVAQSVLLVGDRAYVSDNLGRIAEINIALGGVMTRLWKGYRHASVGILPSGCICIHPVSRSEACEIWTLKGDVARSPRIVAVPSGSRLLENGWLLVGESFLLLTISQSAKEADAETGTVSRRSSVDAGAIESSDTRSPRTAEALDDIALAALSPAALLSYHLRRNRFLSITGDRLHLANQVVVLLRKRPAIEDERISHELKLLECYVNLLKPKLIETDIKRQTWGDTAFGASLLSLSKSLNSAETIAHFLLWLKDTLPRFGVKEFTDDVFLTPEIFEAVLDSARSFSFEAFCRGESLQLIFKDVLNTSIVSNDVRSAASLVFSPEGVVGRSLVNYLLHLPLTTLLQEQAPVSSLPNPAVVQLLNDFNSSEYLSELASCCPASYLPQLALLCAFSGMKETVDSIMSVLSQGQESMDDQGCLVWSASTQTFVSELNSEHLLKPLIQVFMASTTESPDLKVHRIHNAINALNAIDVKSPELSAVAYVFYLSVFADQVDESSSVVHSVANKETFAEICATAIALLRVALTYREMASLGASGTILRAIKTWFLNEVSAEEIKFALTKTLVLQADQTKIVNVREIPKLIRHLASSHAGVALEIAELYDVRSLVESDLLYGLVAEFQDWRLDEVGWTKQAVKQVATRCLNERLAFVTQSLGDDLSGSGGILFSIMRPEEVERLVALDLGETFVRHCERLRVPGVLRSIILAGSAPNVVGASEVRDFVNKARKLLDSLPDLLDNYLG